MANILVSLVSDQTVPNLLMIRELADIGRYIFVSTEKMEKQGRTDWIIDGAGISPQKCERIEVIEDALWDIEEKLKAVEYEDADRFFINLTGGTKIMSIGVYNFFRERDSEIYYVPIGRNTFRIIFPVRKERDKPIAYRVSITEYLKSYGVQILHEEKLNYTVRSKENTEAFFQAYMNLTEDHFHVLNQLRDHRSKKKVKKVKIEQIKRLDLLLEHLTFQPESPDKLSKEEIRYLTGDWFEEYVYYRIKDGLNLREDQIAIDIKIKRKDVENQFDVMFTSGNALHVIECKSNVYDAKSDKNVLNRSIYKLAALRRDFGLFVKSYVFTLSDRGDAKKDVRQSEIERSKFLNIQLVDKTGIISELDDMLSKIAV